MAGRTARARPSGLAIRVAAVGHRQPTPGRRWDRLDIDVGAGIPEHVSGEQRVKRLPGDAVAALVPVPVGGHVGLVHTRLVERFGEVAERYGAPLGPLPQSAPP